MVAMGIDLAASLLAKLPASVIAAFGSGYHQRDGRWYLTRQRRGDDRIVHLSVDSASVRAIHRSTPSRRH